MLDEVKFGERIDEIEKSYHEMMDVLEEYSGIRMTWLELKQFGYRQNGWI